MGTGRVEKWIGKGNCLVLAWWRLPINCPSSRQQVSTWQHFQNGENGCREKALLKRVLKHHCHLPTSLSYFSVARIVDDDRDNRFSEHQLNIPVFSGLCSTKRSSSTPKKDPQFFGPLVENPSAVINKICICLNWFTCTISKSIHIQRSLRWYLSKTLK